jgi:hypothetical protein
MAAAAQNSNTVELNGRIAVRSGHSILRPSATLGSRLKMDSEREAKDE